MAKEIGLQFDFDTIKPGNTGLAHELYKYFESINKAQGMADRLFAAYFEEGKDISDEIVLQNLAEGIGIDKKEAIETLKKKIYRDAVINDQKTAGKMDITGVPFFVLNDSNQSF